MGVASALAGCASEGDEPGTSFTLVGPGHELIEGQPVVGVAVRLHSGTGPLAEDVTVEVVDLQTGSASAGSDYVPVGTTVLLFPAGAASGTELAVPLVLLDDDLVEGAIETIDLALGTASLGSAAGSYRVEIADQDVALVQFSSAQSGPADEASAPHDLVVELQLESGVILGVPISVSVEDLGAGTATSGLDYLAFAPQVVDFPPGSVDGASRTVQLTVQDDGDGEPQETVVLSLSSPSPGATLGGSSVHQVLIPDDDGGVGASLVVSVGATGIESLVEADDVVELGSGSTAAPATTQLRVANQGVGAMSLSPPILTGPDAGDFHVELELGSSTLGLPAPGVVHDMHTPLLAGVHQPGLGTPLTLDAFGYQELRATDHVRVFGFPLTGHGEVTLELDRVPLPIADGAVVHVDGVPAPGGLRDLVGELSMWRGQILELPGSRVVLSVSEAGPTGYIELPDQPERFVHIDPGARTGQPGTARILSEQEYLAFGGSRGPASCDGARPIPGRPPEELQLPMASELPQTAALGMASCELAIETDFQLFQKFGTAQDTAAYVTQLVAAVSDRYVQDVHTSLSIAYLGVHTSAADPWSSQDDGGTPGELLDEFQAAWVAAGWPVPADLAHFVSGASLGGGVAYVDALCSSNYGFGVSASIGGQIDWETWTGQPGHFTWDFVVLAHELGHNFGASHTHNYCPPLDHCSTNCDASTSCSQGTIMSYCHGCGGMDNIDLRFHPQIADIMRERVAASCLDSASLAGGEYVQWSLSFAPAGPSGPRAAQLEIGHDAADAPQPFLLGLTGQAP